MGTSSFRVEPLSSVVEASTPRRSSLQTLDLDNQMDSPLTSNALQPPRMATRRSSLSAPTPQMRTRRSSIVAATQGSPYVESPSFNMAAVITRSLMFMPSDAKRGPFESFTRTTLCHEFLWSGLFYLGAILQLGHASEEEAEGDVERFSRELAYFYGHIIIHFSKPRHIVEDRLFFETVHNMMCHVSFAAFPRRSWNDLTQEIGRVLRSDTFNINTRQSASESGKEEGVDGEPEIPKLRDLYRDKEVVITRKKPGASIIKSFHQTSPLMSNLLGKEPAQPYSVRVARGSSSPSTPFKKTTSSTVTPIITSVQRTESPVPPKSHKMTNRTATPEPPPMPELPYYDDDELFQPPPAPEEVPFHRFSHCKRYIVVATKEEEPPPSHITTPSSSQARLHSSSATLASNSDQSQSKRSLLNSSMRAIPPPHVVIEESPFVM